MLQRIATIALLASLAAAPARATVGYAVGDTAVDMTAHDQAGTSRSLSEFSGKWVLLDFCAAWCGPCKFMGSEAQQVYDSWAGHPSVSFEYVSALINGATFTASTESDAADWAANFSNSRPVLHADGNGGAPPLSWFAAAGFGAVPTVVYLDPDRVIRRIHVGYQSPAEINQAITDLAGLAGDPPPPPPPPAVFPLDRTTLLVSYGANGGSSGSDGGGGFLNFLEFEPFPGASAPLAQIISEVDPSTHVETMHITFASIDLEPIGRTQPWRVRLSGMAWPDHLPRKIVGGGPAPGLVLFRASDGGEEPVVTALAIDDTVLGTGMRFRTFTLDDIPGAPSDVVGFSITNIRLERDLSAQNVGVGDAWSPLPGSLALAAPWPNPARSGVTLRWTLSGERPARLDVFDASGRRVRTLARGTQSAGVHEARWDLANDRGERVRPGLYFARLSGERGVTRRIAVIE